MRLPTVILCAATFSPEIANELFLGARLDQAGYTHCVFKLEGGPAVGNLPGTGPLGLPEIKFDNAELGDGATNVQVDDECPLRFVSHGGMIVDPVVFEMVDDALAGRTIDVPVATCLLPPIPSPI